MPKDKSYVNLKLKLLLWKSRGIDFIDAFMQSRLSFPVVWCSYVYFWQKYEYFAHKEVIVFDFLSNFYCISTLALGQSYTEK